MTRSKMIWALVGLLVGATCAVTAIIAAEGGLDIPVSAEGVLVDALFNTDWQQPANAASRADLEKVIEGSVSFRVDVPFEKIQAHMQDPGTWGKISPDVSDYTATKTGETDFYINYHIEQTMNPVKFPGLGMLGPSKISLNLTINKRAAKEDAIAVHWALDPTAPAGLWKRFEGRVYGVNLHTGNTMVLVTTSTQSAYPGIPDRVRLNLAKHYLAKSKDNITHWLASLN